MGRVRYAVGSRLRRSRRWARKHKRSIEREVERHRRPRVRSACYAPHSGLYFRPDGAVQACCATGFEVGRVHGPGAQTLTEIWEGALLQSQRRSLEANRFDLGCQECEAAIESGSRATSLASHFDRWRLKSPYAFPQLLDFALSSRCNLQCVMCNGELSSAIRTQREGRPPMPAAYDDAFFEELARYLPHAVRTQFKGGEPFLAPENKRVWDLMIEQGSTCEVTITTNATIWNDEVERYVRALRAEPNISVDGMTPEVLESIRVGTDFTKVWANIDRFQAVAEDVGRPVTLSFCLMTTNWHQLPEFLDEVDRRGVFCFIILVNQPDRYDVLKLPPDELGTIIDTLASRAPGLRTPRTREEWHRILGRLRSHLVNPIQWKVEIPPRAVPVAITTPPSPEPAPEPAPPEEPPPPPVDLDAVRHDLSQRAGVTPAEAVVRGGTVVEAGGPAWADWLGLDHWGGQEEHALVDVLADQVAVAPDITLGVSPHERVTEARITWAESDDIAPLLVWVVPVDDGPDDERRLLLVPASVGPVVAG